MARLDELERKFEENPRRYFAPLANEYRKAGDAGRAAELCRAHLPGIPGHISGHIVLGQALYDGEDYPGSRSALETALTLDPENIVALRYLGDIARDTGDVEGARRWYNRTLEADPYSEAAQAGLDSLNAPSPEPLQEREEIALQRADAPSGAIEAPRAIPEFETVEGVSREVESVEAQMTELESSGEESTRVDLSEPPVLEREAVGVESLEPDTIATESREAQSNDWTSGTVVVDQPSPIEMAAEVGPAHHAADLVQLTEELPAEPAESLEMSEQIPDPYEDIPAVSPEVPEASAEILEPSADMPEASSEFAGDLDVSAVAESTDSAREEITIPETDADVVEAGPIESPDVVTNVDEERVVDVEAHREPEPFATAERSEPSDAVQEIGAPQTEDSIQTEERVLEAAAPFVTETMADLYMEQGYPHEALELMLQLAEQRPEDESLRLKIGLIESAILARRDAAVAVARAERAEAAEAQPDAAAAEVSAAGVSAPDVAPAPPKTVQQLFARMDGSRPRVSHSVTPQPAPVLRSDFVPMQDARPPLGVDRTSDWKEQGTGGVPRTSGSHQKFDPSTAAIDDFDAWLRGLRGP